MGSALFLGKDNKTIDFAAAGVSDEVIKIIDDAQALRDAGDTRAIRNIFGGNFGPNWFAQFNDYMISDGTTTKVDKERFDNFMVFKNEVVGTYKADISAYVRQKLVDWASGDEALTDATWDAYKKQLEQMGLAELNKVYQSAFSCWSGQQQ